MKKKEKKKKKRKKRKKKKKRTWMWSTTQHIRKNLRVLSSLSVICFSYIITTRLTGKPTPIKL
jgi:hypothetical protein